MADGPKYAIKQLAVHNSNELSFLLGLVTDGKEDYKLEIARKTSIGKYTHRLGVALGQGRAAEAFVTIEADLAKVFVRNVTAGVKLPGEVKLTGHAFVREVSFGDFDGAIELAWGPDQARRLEGAFSVRADNVAPSGYSVFVQVQGLDLPKMAINGTFRTALEGSHVLAR
jgi:hypothetical protein